MFLFNWLIFSFQPLIFQNIGESNESPFPPRPSGEHQGWPKMCQNAQLQHKSLEKNGQKTEGVLGMVVASMISTPWRIILGFGSVKWPVVIVKSPRPGVVGPFEMACLWLWNGGDPKYWERILQVEPWWFPNPESKMDFKGVPLWFQVPFNVNLDSLHCF